MRRPFMLLVPCFIFSAACSTAQTPQPGQAYASRASYGSQLEPKGNAILHGAGRFGPEGWKDFDAYSELLLDRAPVLSVSWLRLREERLAEFFSALEAHFLTHEHACLIPQIGIMMNDTEEPAAHYEDQVAAGQLDDRIRLLSVHLERLNRPVFLRVGFAFNGEWNNYDPKAYQDAFVHMRQTLVEERPVLKERVAFVWSFAPAGADDAFKKYYPGDEHVDWWALDVFNIFDTKRECTERFLREAHEHRKPVMVAEATPLGIGTANGRMVWEKWFEDFFEFVRANAGIKAVCYLNRDWTEFPRWAAWGDCRLENNAKLSVRYYKELGKEPWVHGTCFESNTTINTDVLHPLMEVCK